MENNKKHVPNYEISTYNPNGEFSYLSTNRGVDTKNDIIASRGLTSSQKDTGGSNDGVNKANK